MRRDDHRAGRGSAGRLRGPALTTAVLAVLGLLAVRLADIARSSWADLAVRGPARPDEAVAALAATAGLILTGWLLVAVTLSVVAAAAGSHSGAGRALGGITRRVAPLVLRNAVAAALGVVVATTPAVAQAAALTPSASAGSSATSQSYVAPPAPSQARSSAAQPDGSADLSPVWQVTTADRRLTADRSPTTAASTPGVSREGDLRPGWTPTRPLKAPGTLVRTRPAAPVAAAPRRSTGAHTGDVVVRRGDTLWSIAARHLGPSATDAEIALVWPRWFTANRAVIGADPDRLRPGERLRPPSMNHGGGAR